MVSLWQALIVFGGCGVSWWVGRQHRSHADMLIIRHLQREISRLRDERRFAVGTTRSGRSTMVPREFYDQDTKWYLFDTSAPRPLRDKDGEK
jgi:xanthine dehydrogenase iron-sulfur cluster and FAD-binding subunit A